MIYITEDEKIKGYNVIINKKGLKKIKKDIINNCSNIEHKKEEASCYAAMGWEPSINYEKGRQEVRNLKKKLLRIEENKNYRYTYEAKEKIYELEYDLYTYPDADLLLLINNAIQGFEKDAFHLLMIASKVKSKENIDLNISVKTREDAKAAQELLDNLLNAKKNIEYYMPSIKNYISLVLVSEIDYNTYKKFYSFVDKDLKEKIDKKIRIKM